MPANPDAQPMDVGAQVAHLYAMKHATPVISRCARLGTDLAMTMAKLTVTERRDYEVVGVALMAAAASCGEVVDLATDGAVAAAVVNLIAYCGVCEGCTVRYDAVKGWWRIEDGPVGMVGAIAWPFSDEGQAIAAAYAATLTGPA